MASGGTTPDVRRRRAEQAKRTRRGEATRTWLVRYAWAAAILIVAVGVWAGVQQLPERGKAEREESIHRHAVFRMFVLDDEIRFDDCAFDLDGCAGKAGTNYVAAHIHTYEAERGILHIEHPKSLGNMTLGRFFNSLDVNLTRDRVALDDAVHAGRVVESNQTFAWRLWVNPCVREPDQWLEITGKFAGYVPQQHDRMLLTFARRDAVEADFAAQFQAIPTSTQLSGVTYDYCPTVVPSAS